jgi:hypothetical protein
MPANIPSIMPRIFFSSLIASAIIFGLQTIAQGATIQLIEAGNIALTGEIVKGDAEHLAETIAKIPPIAGKFYLLPETLMLNSEGGDVNEALKIASLTKALYLNTAIAPDGYGVCASSCFFVFIAGQERWASGVDQLRNEGVRGNMGPIGVHRPYFKMVKGGPDSAQKQENLMRAVSVYLNEERVPQSIIETMMSRASNDIYWLQSKDLQLLGKYKAGYEEELVAKCGFNTKKIDQMNAKEWIESSKQGVLACARRYNSETYTPLRDANAEKLRHGWRPW